MRVLHVDTEPTWRGGERQVLLLARELARDGHDSLVAAAPKRELFHQLSAAKIPVAPLSIRGDLDPVAIWETRRLLADFQPELLHLHTARAHGAAGLAARLARFSPVLVTRRLELPIRGAFSRWKYRTLADHYIAISGAVERSLLAGGVPKSRVTRIPSGVELAVPRVRRPGPWTVGTLAAFTPQKDPETWLRTVRRVAEECPDAHFVWAGEGELARNLEVAVAEAHLANRVHFPGFLTDLSSFWETIDVFFLPSTFEALGTVLLDAMARSVPVVATEVGGIPEVVRHGREGLLAAARDDRGLAEALLSLHRDPVLARRVGEEGGRSASRYELSRVVREIEALYESLKGRGWKA
jgi:glycosyltransferase involved in cell wall biosynthesis